MCACGRIGVRDLARARVCADKSKVVDKRTRITLLYYCCAVGGVERLERVERVELGRGSEGRRVGGCGGLFSFRSSDPAFPPYRAAAKTDRGHS